MIAFAKDDPLPPPHVTRSHLIRNTVTPRFVKDRRVCYPQDSEIVLSLKLFPLKNAVSDLNRCQLKTDIRLPLFYTGPLAVKVSPTGMIKAPRRHGPTSPKGLPKTASAHRLVTRTNP